MSLTFTIRQVEVMHEHGKTRLSKCEPSERRENGAWLIFYSPFDSREKFDPYNRKVFDTFPEAKAYVENVWRDK